VRPVRLYRVHPAAGGVKQLALELVPEARPANERPRTSFHARSPVTGAEVRDGEAQAKKQEASILGYFQAFARVNAVPGSVPGRWTPSEVAAMFPTWPITSVRARITTLERAGRLKHWPRDRRLGPYGRLESTWSLAEKEQKEDGAA